jgi:uncharacterized damage-inducible protein DinB
MNEIQRIADQLHRSQQGEAWAGPSLREVLAGVTAEKAAAHPIQSGHSIWELVLHVIAWQGVVVRRLNGEAVELPESENFPAVTTPDEPDWQRTLAELTRSTEELSAALGRLTTDRLSEVVPGQKYSVYIMVHGVIQHNLYHAGQIALLKKA